MLCFAVYAIAVCFDMFVLMYSRWWERGYDYVYNLHMIRKMYVGCDGLCIGFRLCDWLHEHILMRASDRTTRGFCLCDYPVYAEENICHAFHSCVPRCMSVWLCLRTGRLTVWLRQIRLDFIELVFVCATSPGVRLCDFTRLVWLFSAGTYMTVWLCLPHDSSRRG